MGAEAERQVLADLAVDVESVAVGRNCRWSRLAAPMSNMMTLPSRTVWSWSSTSRATYAHVRRGRLEAEELLDRSG